MVEPFLSMDFREYGGAECFLWDINGDGCLEVLTYRGPGVFGAKMYAERDWIKPLLPAGTSVSAFTLDGRRLWTWGEQDLSKAVFISHAYESCLAFGDVDGDGLCEIAVADGDSIVLISGTTGAEKGRTRLPWDNFYIVQCAKNGAAHGGATLVVKNGEDGYDGWGYGEPAIGLNSSLEPVWGPASIPGAGHHILPMKFGTDINGFLIGYSAVSPEGSILWNVDSVDVKNYRPVEEHVDYTDTVALPDGKTLLAMAGSDKLYLTDDSGKTIFSVEGSHVQGSAIGRFTGNGELQIALYNAPDGPLVFYSTKGEELLRVATPRRWPAGTPESLRRRVFHRNRPIVSIPGRDNDWVGFADGGWPWGMDGAGKMSLLFSMPEEAGIPELPESLSMNVRADDVGASFAMKVADIDGDGCRETIIYNRRHLWAYRTTAVHNTFSR